MENKKNERLTLLLELSSFYIARCKDQEKINKIARFINKEVTEFMGFKNKDDLTEDDIVRECISRLEELDLK